MRQWLTMRAPVRTSDKKQIALQDVVRNAHVAVATEVRDQAIQNFTCRELPLGRLNLYDISIDPIVIRRRSEDIRQDENDDFLLAAQVHGSVIVSQGGCRIYAATRQSGAHVCRSALFCNSHSRKSTSHTSHSQ